MNKPITHELKSAWLLLQGHYVAIIVASYATAMMALMSSQSSPLPRFSSIEIDALIYYGLIPLFILFALLRKNPLQLGIGLGDYKFWIPASLAYLAITLPIVYMGASLSSVQQYYSDNAFNFMDYLIHVTLFMLGWEYLFRGFLLVGLRDSLKEGAILVQMIPFTLLHLGKPDIEIIACIIPGLVWGYICYRSNSFWPAFFIHLITNVFLKLLAVGIL